MATSSHAPEKRDLKAAEELSFKTNTMLDAVFTSKVKKKPTWITTTMGSKTTIWRVSRTGNLEEVAAIRWSSVPDSSLHSSHSTKNDARRVILVEINGELYPAEKFGKRSKGGITNPGGTFAFKVDDMECKWSEAGTHEGYYTRSEFFHWKCSADISILTETYSEVTKKDDPLPESTSPSSSRPVTAPAATTISPPASTPTHSRFKSLFSPFKKSSPKPHAESITLAEYFHAWNVHQTAMISVYQQGVPYIFYLLITLILFNTQKDEWKHVQSSTTPDELRAMLNADLRGNLPMYTPARTDNKSKTKANRRPRTANLHPTVSATSPWRWDATGNDHDREGNPLNLSQGSQATPTLNAHYITQ